LIRTEHLTKQFGKFTAVRDLALTIREGEIYGFLGPNGAGKTTTINMLLGILKPSSGTIFYDNTEVRRGDIAIRSEIGVVPENHPRGMWKWMTAWEYLDFFAEMFCVKQGKARTQHLLESVNLADVAHKRIAEFSRGMLQKLSFARALLPTPRMLVLDEPISGLDPIGVRQIRDLLEEENKNGRTILVSSHLLSEIEKICHRVAIISDGILLSEDSKEDLMTGLHEERDIMVELEHPSAELRDQMLGVPEILAVELSEAGILVKVPRNGDYRKIISQFLIDHHHVPLSIQEKSSSLEDIFITITKDKIKSIPNLGEGS
jgi:ABC-type multidrug transport system ATPase subunit